MLEDLLRRERSGELQSLAVATVSFQDGKECTGSAWTLSRLAQFPVLLLGAVEVTRSRLLRRIDAG